MGGGGGGGGLFGIKDNSFAESACFDVEKKKKTASFFGNFTQFHK